MRNIFLIAFIACSMNVIAQKPKTENIIIFTMDGMRWQEVFGGIDSVILNNPEYTHEKDDIKSFLWSDDITERRKKLFPFLWNTVAQKGQLYGNRAYGNYINVANPYAFSYPGYNEIFTGYPDTAVNSNDKIPNKNENVLEFINKQKAYKNKVAAFSTWDVSPYFLNKWRSGIYVNADNDSVSFDSNTSNLINDIQQLSMKPNGERLDIVTYIAAREYLKKTRPKVLYISFDETDEYAHQGKYDYYLGAAHAEDGMMSDIWNLIQSMPAYKDKTTLIVTCDHGRGDKIKSQWRDHGQKVEDAGGIWLAVVGPDTPPAGEMKSPGQLYQKQIAATVAALLGFEFKPAIPAGEKIQSILK